MRSIRKAAAVVLATVVLLAAGLPRLESSSHYSAYFDADDAAWLEHERILAEYGLGESMLVLLESGDRDFLTPDRWFLLEDLADALREIPDVRTVLAASEFGIGGIVETPSGQLIPDRDALIEHGRVLGLLLSDDAYTAALFVDVSLADHRAETVLEISAAIEDVVERFTRGTTVKAAYTGTLAMGSAYVEVVRSDLRIIMPLLLGTLFVLFGVLLGGLRAVVSMLPVMLLPLPAAFGLAGWLSAELAAINTFAPIMILTISTAGAVHLLLAYQRSRADGTIPSKAARVARQHVFRPMTIANATTVLGFLALLLSPSPPLRVVGLTVAVGVAVSWLVCLVLAPSMLERFDPRASLATRLSRPLRRLTATMLRQYRPILFASAGAAVIAAMLVSRNTVSDSVFEYFADDHPFSVATQQANDRLVGVNELLYSIDLGAEDAIFDDRAVRSIADYAAWLRMQPEVIRVSSLLDTDIVRQAMQDDRLASLLERMRGRNQGPLERRELTMDRSAMLFAVYLEPLDSSEIVAFDQRARVAAAEQLPAFGISSGGASLAFAHLGERNIRSMLLASSLGLVFAAVLFGAILRSTTIAVVGVACNVLPVLAVYAVWAVFVGSISIGAATVMGMILGIVIDDTVYLLTAWWRLREDKDAITNAVAEVGPALVATSLILAMGLAVGLMSAFSPVWSMSALSAGIIVTALVIDLVALPAMLGRLHGRA